VSEWREDSQTGKVAAAAKAAATGENRAISCDAVIGHYYCNNIL